MANPQTDHQSCRAALLPYECDKRCNPCFDLCSVGDWRFEQFYERAQTILIFIGNLFENFGFVAKVRIKRCSPRPCSSRNLVKGSRGIALRKKKLTGSLADMRARKGFAGRLQSGPTVGGNNRVHITNIAHFRRYVQ